MNNTQNCYSDIEHLELVARRIAESGTNLTSDYKSWMDVTFACASLGEQARESYHQICSQYPGYKREECDEKFNNCLKSGRGVVTLGTLMKMAADNGIDVSKPRGRRTKTNSQRKQETEDRINHAYELLRGWAKWRFNTWLNRPEIQEPDNPWRPVCERDLSTYYCRLKEAGQKISSKDVQHIIFNRDFTGDYDPFGTYLDQLPKWQDGDP